MTCGAEPCMCGDPSCPFCGPRQGTYPESEASATCGEGSDDGYGGCGKRAGHEGACEPVAVDEDG